MPFASAGRPQRGGDQADSHSEGETEQDRRADWVGFGTAQGVGASGDPEEACGADQAASEANVREESADPVENREKASNRQPEGAPGDQEKAQRSPKKGAADPAQSAGLAEDPQERQGVAPVFGPQVSGVAQPGRPREPVRLFEIPAVNAH